MSEPLSDRERAVLDYFRAHGSAPEKRRAQIILLNNDCTELSAIAQAIPLSTAQVRHWLREWEARRLDIFPTPPLAEVPAPLDTVTEPAVTGPRLMLDQLDQPGVLPDDPVSEAARKLLLFHFGRMLLNETGSRQGEDIEAVHDMRVSTRRMRSAMRLFRSYFDPAVIQHFQRELRRIAQTLGEVRDLDVFLDKARMFAAEHSGVDLQPLYDIWGGALTEARQSLNDELDSKRFDRFVSQFHQFLSTPYAGARGTIPPRKPIAYQVRHVAPGLIYNRYAAVRAFEPLIEQADIPTLHRLRIAFKRLRYALEFFEEVLGPEVQLVIKETKIMQDHLGDLQDAQVVSAVLDDLRTDYEKEYSGVPGFMRPDMSGVLVYSSAKEDEKRALYETVPQAWANFVRDEVRQSLGLAVAAL